jgi:hypothetical protein
MSKRLQVVLKDPEYREIQRAARSRNLTVSEWVRQALAVVRRQEPSGSVEKKLAAIRAAAQVNAGPAVEIEQMLEEIERGYQPGPQP